MKYSQPIFIKTWQQQVNKQTNKNLLTTITVLDQEQTANIVHQCFHLESTDFLLREQAYQRWTEVKWENVLWSEWSIFIKMFIYACYRARYRTSQNTQ